MLYVLLIEKKMLYFFIKTDIIFKGTSEVI